MDPNVIVLLSIMALIGLLIVGLPISISLASSGIVGLVLLNGVEVTSSVIAGTTFTAVGQSSLIVVPMFILMGMFTLHGGIAEKLFAIASRLLRWLPGGLGVATVFSSAGFGAISGSSLASVATLGKTCITEMMRHGYQRSFASATVAVAGTLAVLIPPSIILILYGVITGESIGSLLIAGIIPGIVSAIVLGLMVIALAWRRPALVNTHDPVALAIAFGEDEPDRESGNRRIEDGPEPVVSGGDDGAATGDLKTATRAKQEDAAVAEIPVVRLTPGVLVHSLGGVTLLFTIVIGGIYSGIFTPTESAAVGAFAAFLLVCLQDFKRPATLARKVSESIAETVSLSGMIFFILVGAGIFSFFLVSAGTPAALSAAVLDLPVPPIVVVLALLLLLVPLGMFLDPISLLVITVPLVYPPIMELGYDGIWLGILVVKLIEIGMITPPVGMNAYVAAGTVRGLQIEEVFRGIIPFYLADVIIVALLLGFPGIVTWLPSLMG